MFNKNFFFALSSSVEFFFFVLGLFFTVPSGRDWAFLGYGESFFSLNKMGDLGGGGNNIETFFLLSRRLLRNPIEISQWTDAESRHLKEKEKIICLLYNPKLRRAIQRQNLGLRHSFAFKR